MKPKPALPAVRTKTLGKTKLAMDDPSSAVAKKFRASMPASYRRTHGWAAIQEHSAIVSRRQGALSHLETWRVRRGTVVVIVTDDRPGALSMMSAAIAVCGLDILAAEAYCRVREIPPPEAVAFFELRRAGDAEGEPVDRSDVARITEAFEELLRGETDTEALLRRNAPTVRPGPQATTEVTFADDDGTAILLVEARDRPGLLATITSTVSDEGARIVDSEIVTVDGRARDRFRLVESDGSPIATARRALLAKAVLEAVERSTR